MKEAYGADMVTTGDGGSIPLCEVLRRAFARAEITLIGVQDPLAGIHGPNESVYPHEIASMALAEALFLTYYAVSGGRSYRVVRGGTSFVSMKS